MTRWESLGPSEGFWWGSRVVAGAGKAAGGLGGPPVSASSLLPPQNENLVAREAFAETLL